MGDLMSTGPRPEPCDDTAPVISKLTHPLHYWWLYGFAHVVMVMTSLCFHVFMLSKLHAYELLCYARATAELLESSEAPLPFLNEVEALIGARFRRASQTWAAATVRCIAVACLICVFLMLQIVAGRSSGMDALWCFAAAAMYLTLVVLLGMPLARVAEVFEYDVLRALNTPLVINHSQKHLGQQLLSHLSTLGWGFRIGGTVVNMRLVSSIVMVALTSSVAIASKKVADLLIEGVVMSL